MSSTYFLNLYLQQVLGFDASPSGAALVLMTALMVVLLARRRTQLRT